MRAIRFVTASASPLPVSVIVAFGSSGGGSPGFTQVAPGATAFTVMPVRPSSSASARVIWSTAAFEPS